MRLPRWIIVISLLAIGSQGRAADPQADLQAGNEAARTAYRAARAQVLAESGPVVLYDGDQLIFRYGTVRRVTHPTPVLYHDLKTVGHMVLGMHALLTTFGDGPLTPVRVFEVKSYVEAVGKVRGAIRQRGLTMEQQDRQEKILAACDKYLGQVLEEGRVRLSDLYAVLHTLVEPLGENTREAARAQLDGLHRDMLAYRAQLSATEWTKVRVIVQGSAQPRKGHLAVQYFARLLGESGEGRRILYAEAIFDEDKALALLGVKDIDARVGQDVWGEPLRLHQDLLGPAAKVYLNELFEKK